MLSRNKSKENLQKHVVVIQRKAAAAMAFTMTLFLFCIEHVKAFTQHNSLSAHETLVLMSAASSMARRFSSAYINSRNERLHKIPNKTHSLAGSFGSRAFPSSTCLSMAWSMPSADKVPPITVSSLRVFGSWYNEMNPTSRSVVYEDSYVSDYSFSSPADDWPTAVEENEINTSTIVIERRRRSRPIRAIRRALARALGNGRSL